MTNSNGTIKYNEDKLTGLADSDAFRAMSAFELARIRKTGRRPAIIFYDIEDFKMFNRRYGYAEGNKLLVQLGGMIRETFPDALIARFGDDHFIVLCSDDTALGMNNRLQEMVEKRFPRYHVELRAGIYLMEENDGIDRACDWARTACSKIRNRYNKSRYCIFDDQLKQQFYREKYIVREIDNAIKQHHIKLYMQPVMRVLTGRICGFEALARWEDPVYGLMQPGIFIPLLEDYYLIHKLDLFMLEEVCKWHAQLEERGIPILPVSVNISRIDFEKCDMAEKIESIEQEYHVPKDHIIVEITESVLGGESDFLRNEIDRLRARGNKVWMDDFGFGYSSLGVLQDYHFDTIKFDMKFLRNLGKNNRASVTLSSLVSMAKKLGMGTLVEGVESAEQLDFLRSIGCEKAQGYYIARPYPLGGEFIDLVAGRMNLEERGEAGYFDVLGRIDMISVPLFDVDNRKDRIPNGAPLAIIETGPDGARIINANDLFRDGLWQTGITSLSEADDILSNNHSEQIERLNAAISLCAVTGTGRDVTVVTGNYICTLSLHYIAYDPVTDKNALLVKCTYFSSLDVYGKRRRSEKLYCGSSIKPDSKKSGHA